MAQYVLPPLGRTFHADTATREAFYGADSRGSRVFNPPAVDVAIYDVNYNGTSLIYEPGRQGSSAAFWFDPVATTSYASLDDIFASPTADRLDAVERVVFNDGVLKTWAGDGGASMTYTLGLYDYIGRDAIDRDGLFFWLKGFDELRLSAQTIATDFVQLKAAAADEGLGQRDPEANRAFVEYLYLDILHRDGEESGVAFWTNSLDQGLATRGEVLAEFVGSSAFANETTWLPFA